MTPTRIDVANRSRLGWYVRRLGGMSPGEVGWRVHDRLRQEAWSYRGSVRNGWPAVRVKTEPRLPGRPPPLPAPELDAIPAHLRAGVVTAADELLDGRATILGVTRCDMEDPNWMRDPISGQTYGAEQFAFRIDHRSPSDPRNVKQVWELSRHHHLTILSCAWRLTGDDRYADAVDRHLRSWWSANPILRGVNWASGIELGIRLISWVWTRRLLDGWSGAPALFEHNRTALEQIYWHQRVLAAFRSRGSSANNHVIAEAAGQLVASCAFPWFAESARWRTTSARLLDDELAANTFPDGVNREQAFEYHGLVAELALVAAAEAEAAGTPLAPSAWTQLCRMLDVTAALVDRTGRPPRYGDGDNGRALVLDSPDGDRWRSLLAAGASIVGPCPWWPMTTPDVRSTMLRALAGGHEEPAPRPERRPSHFPHAGLTVLRSPAGADEELWCRCDGGPHGYLKIAAHAHADALSIEFRHDGVEILADPGTYCYQGNPLWRRYFRSTRAHNTLELDAVDQSVPGGPFMWTSHAGVSLVELDLGDGACGVQRWAAEHDGYRRLTDPALHRRVVVLDPAARALVVEDVVESSGPHALRLTFHLGPSVSVALQDEGVAMLAWQGRAGPVTARLDLPPELAWTSVRGSEDPPCGWYSASFGQKEPATTLEGVGRVSGTAGVQTSLRLTSPPPTARTVRSDHR